MQFWDHITRGWAGVVAGTLFLGVVLLGISLSAFKEAKEETLSHIDQKLHAGASSVKHILPEGFHDRAIHSEAISAETDSRNIATLTGFARQANFTFLYTLIKKDKEIYITSSSATKEELENGEEVRFFTHFEEADAEFFKAFERESPIVFTHQDRWGTFRALAVQEVTPGGRKYLSVAENEISYVNSILKTKARETIVEAVLIVLGALPLFLLLLRKLWRMSEERKRMEQQLHQAQKMEAIGRLAGGVAHDFNNMLGVIIGRADMILAQMKPDQPFHASLTEIRKAGERSAGLARNLLAFARKQIVAPKVIDLNETVDGMLKMLHRLIGEDIDLVWIPGEEVWPVKIDPVQIDQILANLCVNARDAIADVGKVTIETGNSVFDGDYCRKHAGFIPGEFTMLAVSDNGCGMDAETLENIFEPFFTTKDSDKGTGLGLASVYGAIKQNHGFINVYSEPGQGTTFRIYLPRHAAEAAETKAPGPQAAQRGSETILLVEDESVLLNMITTMLEQAGYKVLAAGTPGEAIALARDYAGEIHLLLTDVVMPEMNGRDLAENLLSFFPDLKRLFMSGYTANVIARHGVLDEGVHFIQKPFSNWDLTVKVREALEG